MTLITSMQRLVDAINERDKKKATRAARAVTRACATGKLLPNLESATYIAHAAIDADMLGAIPYDVLFFQHPKTTPDAHTPFMIRRKSPIYWEFPNQMPARDMRAEMHDAMCLFAGSGLQVRMSQHPSTVATTLWIMAGARQIGTIARDNLPPSMSDFHWRVARLHAGLPVAQCHVRTLAEAVNDIRHYDHVRSGAAMLRRALESEQPRA